MMKHYIHTMLGVMGYLGLNEKTQVKRRVKKSLDNGREPCKEIGGITMYDINELLGSAINPPIYTNSELQIFKLGRLF